jgi:hypothetical protein
MKSITEIIGGAQALFNLSYKLQGCFEEYLTDEYKTFLQMLRVIEDALPPSMRRYAGVGRKPIRYNKFRKKKTGLQSVDRIKLTKTILSKETTNHVRENCTV